MDTFHILRNVKKKLKLKKNLEFFQALISAKTTNAFEKVYNQACNELDENDREILNNFCENHAHFVCFSQVPK